MNADKTERKLNGYVAFYKGERYEVYAETSFEARMKAAQHFKSGNESWKISVILAEQDGKEVVHVPDF